MSSYSGAVKIFFSGKDCSAPSRKIGPYAYDSKPNHLQYIGMHIMLVIPQNLGTHI